MLSRDFFLMLLVIAWAAPAEAASGAKEAFTRMSQCVKEHPDQCREFLTSDSLPLYDRVIADGLAKCLPSDTRYVSEQKSGNNIMLCAATSANGQDRVMRLIYTQKKDAWKLNIPESLRLGMGEKWKERVDMAEQLYLVLRQQLGDKIDCQSARAMVK